MKKQKNKNKKEEWEGCDDCAICQAMKKGEANTEKSLKKAFREAEKNGVGKVGFGDSRDSDSSIPSPYSKK
ncbi:hypothetical protein A2643_00170 [Candidatus Nomurabacteria bacterium RIFCSPHIGHO2_01_FULL_39_220]|uniref:Uncharacterized protein n=1 Tax=Candidatus Nomurabacteria bacterium RIFCSPLOWO2_02_FULL_40_67 TaxID=1801787 RepID=A0A1F6Y3I2_9BACT|nr:MAG: hypothetical protein UU01_C0014G0017 [Parcubacteria group bacterium GW2011_GWA2_40_37]KKS11713.1 MAG: hypothetical protein UU66_C0011G0014 [Parcubacteria group bacterium GW2011_GWB1_41_5]KKS72498.1 MAG: hypothetical protein UV43_C0016G0002 [Parcubacteria group bacterium GW2011_GWF2_42_7]OGI62621.1 MAG: hypothetical protein A2W12_00515 [Candidatus Nomurabacteria bacterium RBG_16_40_11]OGI69531.1 MAG: hypothetical protein A2643_00170 [Candidatus Nomurabacteria bacterium RIFCSPHIGHO2_01_FU